MITAPSTLKIILLCSLTLFCVIAPRSLSFVPLVVGIAGCAITIFRTKTWFKPDIALGAFFTLLVITMGLSSLWSMHPEDSFDRALNTAGILAGGLFFLAIMPRIDLVTPLIARALAATYILFCLFLFSELTLGMPISSWVQGEPVPSYYFNRSVVVLSLLFLPVLHLWNQTHKGTKLGYVGVALLFTSLIMIAAKTSSQSAQAVMLIGVFVYTVFSALKTHRTFLLRAMALVTGLLILTSPLIPGLILELCQDKIQENKLAQDANMMGRLEIWNFAANKIAEKPLLGHGVEAMRNFKEDGAFPINDTDSVLHPHNGFLQIWLEMGLLGGVLAVTFAALMFYRLERAPASAQPLYAAIFLASLSLVSTGYGVWQSWLLGFFIAIAGLAIAFTRIPAPSKA